MNDPEVFENPCAICKVRKATKLCNFVIRYNNSIIFIRDRKKFQEVNAGGHNETCDLPLCDECSSKAGHNVDLCPHHHKLQQQAELPEQFKKAQIRQKAKIFKG